MEELPLGDSKDGSVGKGSLDGTKPGGSWPEGPNRGSLESSV